VLVSIGYPFVFLLIVFGFDLLLAGLFIPLTLGIYWKKANEFGCIAGIAAGIFVRVLLAGLLEGWAFETVMYPEQWYIYTLAAPLVNLVAIVIVSLLTQKLNKPIAVFDNLK
jgi:Na+/proline symporter